MSYIALGRPGQAQYQVRVFLYQARSLPAADRSGLADPFVKIRLAGKTITFPKKMETLNPQWYESLSMNVTLPLPLTLAPAIQVTVYDYDAVGKNESMGRLSVSILEALEMNPVPGQQIKPRWFRLLDWENNEIPDAQILLAFQILTSEQIGALDTLHILPSIVPATIPMMIEITTLGLRSLTSVMGVHKTHIDFELPNGKRFKTKSSKLPNPRNPNFLQQLKIPLDLPIDHIFAPPINIEVRDGLFGGLIKRLIGTASMDIGQFMIMDEKTGTWSTSNNKISVVSDDEVAREMKQEAEELERKQAELKKAIELEAQRAQQQEEERKKKEAEEEERAKVEALVRRNSQHHARTINVVPKESSRNIPTSSPSNQMDEKLIEMDEKKATNGGIGSSDTAVRIDVHDPPHEIPDEIEHTAPLHVNEKDEDPNEDIPTYLRGRVSVDDELEDYMKIEPFYHIDLHTGKKNAGPLGSSYRKIGQFKGLIRLTDPNHHNAAVSAHQEIDIKELLSPKQLYLRLYILRGLRLTPRDRNGLSDPYLIIECGKTKISTRDRYIPNELNPEFFEAFEIPVTIPGDAHVKITCMDWDGVGDDLIGSTTIDIEDRWFCKEWRKIVLKPLEHRTLHAPSSQHPLGKLQLWMELMTATDAKQNPLINIKPPPPQPFELRVIIWRSKEITIKDTITDQNDLYVTGLCTAPGCKKQTTDTHLRSQGGKGSWNWRFKWDVQLPAKNWPRLRLQIWDMDIFSFNDSICETTLNLKGLCKQALKKRDRVKILVNGQDKFWLDNLQHPNFSGSQGKLEISVELVPSEIAAQLPAGHGRSDPNMNVYLPPPEGRVKWSLLHPFDMLKAILGKNLCRKLGCLAFLSLLATALYFLAPMIVTNLIAKGL